MEWRDIVRCQAAYTGDGFTHARGWLVGWLGWLLRRLSGDSALMRGGAKARVCGTIRGIRTEQQCRKEERYGDQEREERERKSKHTCSHFERKAILIGTKFVLRYFLPWPLKKTLPDSTSVAPPTTPSFSLRTLRSRRAEREKRFPRLISPISLPHPHPILPPLKTSITILYTRGRERGGGRK